ncbi:hypothetical protein K457DRAFT_78028 [Linnemannia elongata AG-77]|uniref:Ndc10 domain-containing protein n=1 Tax=Linnemannia elongata AG-77 TaxID=1314771 RepID=A0A197JT34_9FUNG|nr:hypothetical protein K457DRAFT_78028 [Linnemannia elongata AG-77]
MSSFLVLEAAEFDKSGCKVIDVPLGKGSIKLAKKVLIRLHGFQLKRGQVSGLSPTEGSKYQEAVQRYKESQAQQNLQSSHIRSADCAIRDSYNLKTFNDMVSYLWEKKTQEIRDPDLNYRELFCMTSWHNMLLRDEDLRNLNLSDCFASVITKPRHPGTQQLVSLTFKLNKGKTNIGNENWFTCCMRHEDIRRCSFSAFAFYMFQLWQVRFQFVVALSFALIKI